MIPPPGIGAPVCPLIPVQPTLPPPVISFNASYPIAYKNGLRKPRAGLPARRRASLSRAMMPPVRGAAAEVPPEGERAPA